MPAFQTIVVARPLAPTDPIFLKDDKGYLFPRVLVAYEEAGLVSNPVISMPELVAADTRELLASWGLNCVYSKHDLPQLRLTELAGDSDHDLFQVVTPYCYFLNRDVFAPALEAFADSGRHLFFHEAASSSSHFALCDRRAIKALEQYTEFAVPPFVMKTYVTEAMGEEAVESIPQLGDKLACSFLFKILYLGNNGIIPTDIIARYLRDTPEDRLFSEESYRALLCSVFSIDDLSDFNVALATCLAPEELDYRAAQIQFLSRLTGQLPEERGTFLELGYGRAPTTSMLLLNAFDNGIALEPHARPETPVEFVETFSQHISGLFGLDFSRTRDCGKALQSLNLSDAEIQDLDIPDESVDFVYSKVVFEHVMDVETTSRTLHRILKKGGRMFHVICHQDHVDPRTIRFDFLKYDKETWASMQDWTNLWRVNDFVDCWTGLGFKVDVIERATRPLPLKEIHPCWDSYCEADLFCYHSVIVAEKL